ncbi:MAG TPA: bifunctional phosphoglucose/phosphomannose isomerase [Patescibacteria group bacterium]
MAETTKLDPDGMRDCVLDSPSLFEQGYGSKASFPAKYRKAKQVVFCCMGGSATGAGLLGDYLAPDLKIPYWVHRDYDVPGFVGKDTLVICVSHSGTTEETLSGYDEAKRRGAMLAAVTTGGELAKRAKADGAVLVKYESGLQPRAAVPQVLGVLLRTMVTLGLADDHEDTVREAVAHLRQVAETVSDTHNHAAADLAARMHGKIPVIYGSGLTAETARRLKGQVSENAKQTAAWEVVPEENHNALVGLEFPEELRDRVVFVTLRTGYEHPRDGLRFEFLDSALASRGLPGATLRGTGPNRLAHLLTVVFLGDLASILLAGKNGVDPTPVDIIDELKSYLTEAG